MKIIHYTLCWNERDVIPFVIAYWRDMIKKGIDLKVVVYDNGSTDGSLDLLCQENYIEIRHFDTDGMDDQIQREIKNNCWKEARGKCDFVIVSDFDEILYSDNWIGELTKFKKSDCNVIGTKWYCLVGEKMPDKGGDLLHRQIKRYWPQSMNRTHPHLGKFMLFDPDRVNDMGWSVGNHIAHPSPNLNLYISYKIHAIHIDKGLSEDYFVKRRLLMSNRLSDNNRRRGYCVEYNSPEQQQRAEYRERLLKSLEVPF